MSSCLSGSFRALLECVQGPSFAATPSYGLLSETEPDVKFDPSLQGAEVVTVKAGRRVCGSGGVLANTAILQDKAYFEVKVQQEGLWGLGLGPRRRDALDALPASGGPEGFWLLRESGVLFEGSTERGRTSRTVEEGDVIGIAFDHSQLAFYVNGEAAGSLSGMRGAFHPAVFVDAQAILDVSFSGFAGQLPAGFSEIMLEQTLL